MTKKPLLALVPFLLSLAALPWALEAHAGVFQITNRTYGSAPHAAIDALFDGFETTVNQKLPNVSTDSYVKGIANASVASGDGIGVDYASSIRAIYFDASAALGADLGSNSISSLFNGTANLRTLGGFGAQTAYTIGVVPGYFINPKLGPIDLKRLKIFFNHSLTSTYTQSGVALALSSFGVHFQYKLIPQKTFGARSVKWGGLDVTTGFRHDRMNFSYAQALKSSQDTTISSPSTTATVAFDGVATLGADVGVNSIPLEVSSSVRLLYVLGLYAALGMDFNTGSATGISNITGPVTITDTSNALTGVSGSAALDLGSSASPTKITTHFTVGTQIEIAVFAVYAQLSKSLTGSAYGATFGAKAFW